MLTHKLTDRQKCQLLDFFAYYMPMEQRERLMAELPIAYNAWAGMKVVEVVRTRDELPVEFKPDKSETLALTRG